MGSKKESVKPLGFKPDGKGGRNRGCHNYRDKWRGPPPCSLPRPVRHRSAPYQPDPALFVLRISRPFSSQLLLGSGVGTVRLYDTEAKKNLCEININDDMPR